MKTLRIKNPAIAGWRECLNGRRGYQRQCSNTGIRHHVRRNNLFICCHDSVAARLCQRKNCDIFILMKNPRQDVLDAFVAHLKTAKEFDDFFEELLTPREYEDMIDRYRICRELAVGATVQQVCKKLGVASATVVRGNRVLKYGNGQIKKMVK